MTRWTVAVICATGLMLAGCGVKGALYLPEKSSEVIIRPAPGTGPTAEQPSPEPAPAPAETPEPPGD
jgi:predicted small lipoprotein YifL